MLHWTLQCYLDVTGRLIFFLIKHLAMCFFFLTIQKIGPRALQMLGKSSATELQVLSCSCQLSDSLFWSCSLLDFCKSGVSVVCGHWASFVPLLWKECLSPDETSSLQWFRCLSTGMMAYPAPLSTGNIIHTFSSGSPSLPFCEMSW